MKRAAIRLQTLGESRARMLSIACGDYMPKPSGPKIWFTSLRSLAEVLSDEHRALLKLISVYHPESVTTLAEPTSRHTSNLSRTLETMANDSLIEMQREKNQVRLAVKAMECRIVA